MGRGMRPREHGLWDKHMSIHVINMSMERFLWEDTSLFRVFRSNKYDYLIGNNILEVDIKT